MKKVIVSLALFFFPLCSFAQTYEIYECVFTHVNTQKGMSKEYLKLIYEVDEVSGKAYGIGNLGRSEENYVIGHAGKTFIEVTFLGNVMITTIDENMKAVHSRHTILSGGRLIPQQFYGSCIKK